MHPSIDIYRIDDKTQPLIRIMWRPDIMSYWTSVLDTRISRRRGLTLTGTTAAAAAFLAACGGGDSKSDGSGSESKSSIVTKPVETTKSAKKGGVLKYFASSEPAHLDVQLD